MWVGFGTLNGSWNDIYDVVHVETLDDTLIIHSSHSTTYVPVQNLNWWEKSHDEGDAISGEQWYVIVNDLIGGWSIGNRDKPLSQYDMRPETGREERVIADFVKREDAEEYVAIRNKIIKGRPPEVVRTHGHESSGEDEGEGEGELAQGEFGNNPGGDGLAQRRGAISVLREILAQQEEVGSTENATEVFDALIEKGYVIIPTELVWVPKGQKEAT